MHQHTVVATDVHAVESLDDLADDTLVGVAADERVREGIIKGKLRHQVAHPRVEAVVVRLEAVQGDVRQMVGAEDVRHIGLHRLPDALNVEGA